MTAISVDSDSERSEENLQEFRTPKPTMWLQCVVILGGLVSHSEGLPEHFEELWQGRKTFELRAQDRPFAVGDRLHLKEFVPSGNNRGEYTGRRLEANVSHLLRGPVFGLKEGWVVLSLKDLKRVGDSDSGAVPSPSDQG